MTRITLDRATIELLHNLSEPALKSLGYQRVKRASLVTQKRSVGRVLNQRVFEQIIRILRRGLAEY